MGSAIVALLSGLRRLLGLLTLALIAILFAPKLLALFDNPRNGAISSWLLQSRDHVLKATTPYLRTYIPTTIGGADRSDYILAGISVFITMLAGSAAQRARIAKNRRDLQISIRAWREREGVAKGSQLDKQLQSSVRKAEAGNKTVSRTELLQIFAETRKKLDKFGREVAFLAIDVIGSTNMKANEDPSAIQYDFEQYRKLVEDVFRARGALKTAWTPDGVMACFSQVEDACQAGKDVIRSLDRFNREIKLTKAEFAVRCGVNAGLVYFDDAAPLETISDRVIDIAGHMQKHAEKNTVLVARKLIEPIRDLGEFVQSPKVVDGYEASEWRSGAALGS